MAMGIGGKRVGRLTRRDRHGRHTGQVAFSPTLPIWTTRRDHFDRQALKVLGQAAQIWPQLWELELGIEDVPPSDPNRWEEPSAVLSRLFPASRAAALPYHLYLYRLPIQQRVKTRGGSVEEVLRHVFSTQLAEVLGCRPWEVFGSSRP